MARLRKAELKSGPRRIHLFAYFLSDHWGGTPAMKSMPGASGNTKRDEF